MISMTFYCFIIVAIIFLLMLLSDDGAGSLVVDVIDTVGGPDLSFLTRRPDVSPGDLYTDSEFDKKTALGKYAKGLDWKRPQVKLHCYP